MNTQKRFNDPFAQAAPCWMHKHVFEHSGCGVAPFAFVGVVIKKYQACPDAPVQPGGSCAHCGTGIMECCIIRDAIGKEFTVGNVCVEKTGESGLINATKQAVNRVRTEERRKRESTRIKAACEILKQESVRSILAANPHPYADLAAKGLTELSWAEWMMCHAGNAGMTSVARRLESLAKVA